MHFKYLTKQCKFIFIFAILFGNIMANFINDDVEYESNELDGDKTRNPRTESVKDQMNDDEFRQSDENKIHKKRLETIDGVEIASSYKEYIDLASEDIDDRLSKNKIQLEDLHERIKKRSELHDQIEKEIIQKHNNAQELSEKDKVLRNRLIRNTEMQSALTNLADIAGYKLDPTKILPSQAKKVQNTDTPSNSESNETPNILANLQTNANSIANTILNPSSLSPIINTNNTYTRYIEMAYSEVQTILTVDKKTLVEIIRKIKDNEEKLKKLEKLKRKLTNSLKRLKLIQAKLENIIKQDTDVSNILHQLKSIIKQQMNHNLIQIQNKFNDLDVSQYIADKIIKNYKNDNYEIQSANQNSTMKIPSNDV